MNASTQKEPGEEAGADTGDHPDVPVKPPKIVLWFLLAAIIMDFVYNIDLLGWGLQFGAGMILISFGCGLLTWCVMLFTREGTNIPTDRPASVLVEKGPYSISRNPVYISLMSLYLGACVLLDLFWGFLLFPELIYVMNKYVIAAEEDYLEKKFGQSYRAYRARVRRWL